MTPPAAKGEGWRVCTLPVVKNAIWDSATLARISRSLESVSCLICFMSCSIEFSFVATAAYKRNGGRFNKRRGVGEVGGEFVQKSMCGVGWDIGNKVKAP